jgi:hypothetical protein
MAKERWEAERAMIPTLDAVEARVLGCLIEKDLSTPEYYPLTLNALTNACNQKSNRHPVVQYEPSDVRAGLEGLREKGLAVYVSEAGSRAEKYRHRIGERLNLSRGELAVLAELLVRGPQTPGELRTRSERMHEFVELELVAHTLEKLASRADQPLAVQLARQPGTKEARWAQLMCGEVAAEEVGSIATVAAPGAAALQERVENLEVEMRTLREEFEKFRAQFS